MKPPSSAPNSDRSSESARRRILDWIFPARCLGCEETIWETRDAFGLCPKCREGLNPWPPEACRTCGRLLPGTETSPGEDTSASGFLCGGCLTSSPPIDRLFCAWSYEPPLDAVLTSLKFRRLDYLGEDLGRELGRRFGARLADCDGVAAVPLHWLRRFRRGYDQAEILARTLAAEIGLPYLRPLRRVRRTIAQSRLPRAARGSNLQDAFRPRGEPDVWRGAHLALVDDVTTTGATLQAAADCLKKAGASRITAVTAAKTPKEFWR